MAATLELEQRQPVAARRLEPREDLSRRWGGLIVVDYLMNLFGDSPQELFGRIDVLAVLDGPAITLRNPSIGGTKRMNWDQISKRWRKILVNKPKERYGLAEEEARRKTDAWLQWVAKQPKPETANPDNGGFM